MDFKKATLGDREGLNKYFVNNSMASNKNFTNMYIWQDGYNIEFAVDDGFLFVRAQINGSKYYSFPIGGECPQKAVEKILDLWDDDCKFGQLLADEADYLKNNYGFIISEDRDAWEYIYETEKLISLSGKKLHSKKNHYNFFVNSFSWNYEEINSANIEFAREFCLSMVENIDGRQDEVFSLKKLFDGYFTLELCGALLYADGRIAACTVGEDMGGDVALVHVEKADKCFRGSFAAINKMFIENRFAYTKYVNREEDMGIDGLRKAKMSYHPADFVRKYVGVKNK